MNLNISHNTHQKEGKVVKARKEGKVVKARKEGRESHFCSCI
jgi:hypothetical protein